MLRHATRGRSRASCARDTSESIHVVYQFHPCERFNFATAESDYEECGAFHTAARTQAWYQLWTKTNPGSPLKVYKDGATLCAQVSSISFFERGTAVASVMLDHAP